MERYEFLVGRSHCGRLILALTMAQGPRPVVLDRDSIDGDRFGALLLTASHSDSEGDGYAQRSNPVLALTPIRRKAQAADSVSQ